MEQSKENAYIIEVYGKFQTAIDRIEKRFFTGKGKMKFPKFVIAVNNKCGKQVCAFVSPNALFDKSDGKKVQYLAVNPHYLDRDEGGILKTLCHELCHVYEHAYIHIPRNGYHDKAWEDLMRDCGLEPVYLNKSKTAVNENVIAGGAFEEFIEDFKGEFGEGFFNVVEFTESAVRGYKDNHPGEEPDEEGAMADNADKPVKVYNRNKIKYTCPCGNKVWGKGGLHIRCEDCIEEFTEEE